MKHYILINGIPVGTEVELREQIAPMIEESNNLGKVCEDIIRAGGEDNPQEALEPWIESEPGAISCIEWKAVEEVPPEPMTLMQAPIDRKIATVAAKGLMQDYEDHLFMSEEGGFLQINPENPIDIEQAGDIVRRLFQITNAASALDEFGKWQQGAFIDSCEELFGAENFTVTQFVELNEKQYHATNSCLQTFRAFRQHRYALSFTHHKEAFYSKFPGMDDEDRIPFMRELLEISEKFQLTCSQQRVLFRYAKTYGYDAIQEVKELFYDGEDYDQARAEGKIINRADLMERINVREVTQNYIFKFNNIYYHLKGLVDAIPQGATNIICMDDLTRYQQNGTRLQIAEWSQTGEPVAPPEPESSEEEADVAD